MFNSYHKHAAYMHVYSFELRHPRKVIEGKDTHQLLCHAKPSVHVMRSLTSSCGNGHYTYKCLHSIWCQGSGVHVCMNAPFSSSGVD